VQPRGAPEGLWYSGYVHTIREKEVGLRFNKLFKTSQHYHIRFKLNRITLRRQHYALATKFQEDRFLFPTIAPSVSGGNDTDKRKLSYYNHNIATNQQQQQAIRSIVSLPPGSPPFVLFGPYVDP
jgi:helicase MOV-10